MTWAKAANDNEKRWSLRPVKPWGHYKQIAMTAFGPIGIGPAGFEYLDHQIAEWRKE
jgi:hypothetical protein